MNIFAPARRDVPDAERITDRPVTESPRRSAMWTELRDSVRAREQRRKDKPTRVDPDRERGIRTQGIVWDRERYQYVHLRDGGHVRIIKLRAVCRLCGPL